MWNSDTMYVSKGSGIAISGVQPKRSDRNAILLVEEIVQNLEDTKAVMKSCLEMANKVLNQLGMPSLNRSAIALINVELLHEQNYNTIFCHMFNQIFLSEHLSKNALTIT
ncbi:unnamed protein product [Onchocerca flexuosa]|uniref:Dynein light chain n=1 Tax=Onchocerca flexuosa TaxID=387005 RepID=A0A183H9F8_9BILA|nr:unnamed protein product [Onchocerca flexuosa]